MGDLKPLLKVTAEIDEFLFIISLRSSPMPVIINNRPKSPPFANYPRHPSAARMRPNPPDILSPNGALAIAYPMDMSPISHPPNFPLGFWGMYLGGNKISLHRVAASPVSSEIPNGPIIRDTGKPGIRPPTPPYYIQEGHSAVALS